MDETPNPLPRDDRNASHHDTINADYTTVDSDAQRVQEFSISADTVLIQFQELVKQGNIRKIVVKTQDSKTLFEIPLTVGLVGGAVGGVLFPFAAILTGVGILAAKLTIVVEKDAL
jgi:hypothetical protein